MNNVTTVRDLVDAKVLVLIKNDHDKAYSIIGLTSKKEVEMEKENIDAMSFHAVFHEISSEYEERNTVSMWHRNMEMEEYKNDINCYS